MSVFCLCFILFFLHFSSAAYVSFEIIEQAKMKKALQEEQKQLDEQQQNRDAGVKEELEKDLIAQKNNLKEN